MLLSLPAVLPPQRPAQFRPEVQEPPAWGAERLTACQGHRQSQGTDARPTAGTGTSPGLFSCSRNVAITARPSHRPDGLRTGSRGWPCPRRGEEDPQGAPAPLACPQHTQQGRAPRPAGAGGAPCGSLPPGAALPKVSTSSAGAGALAASFPQGKMSCWQRHFWRARTAACCGYFTDIN